MKLFGGKKEESFDSGFGGFGGVGSDTQEYQSQKKTIKHENGIVILSLSVILTAIMVFLTKMVITPFIIKEYSVTADIVPVIVTYLLEGTLILIALYTSVVLMKIRGVRFKWGSDAPYLIGVTSSTVVIVNILLYYMGFDFSSWVQLFGGYGLALIHATVGAFAGSVAMKKIGKTVPVFNLSVVAIIISIIFFVIAHMIIPSSGFSSIVFF